MIERGWVQALVATGALMTHGLSEGAGLLHFQHRNDMLDEELYERGYNRVYDTIELEKSLDDVEQILRLALADLPDGTVLSSHLVCELLGRHLEKHAPGRAILSSALRAGVPIYVPAFTDSELGLDLAIDSQLRVRDGRAGWRFDPFLDLEDFARRIREHHMGNVLRDSTPC